MSWFKRPSTLPDVPARLSNQELQSILAGPNGRGVLTELRKGELAQSERFAESIQQCEQYLEFLRGMKANSDGTAKDIARLLGEVQA